MFREDHKTFKDLKTIPHEQERENIGAWVLWTNNGHPEWYPTPKAAANDIYLCGECHAEKWNKIQGFNQMQRM